MAFVSEHAARGRKQEAPPGRAHPSAVFPEGRADQVMMLRLFRSKPPRLSPDLDRQERQGLGLRQPLAQTPARPPGETLRLRGPRERVLGCGGTWREHRGVGAGAVDQRSPRSPRQSPSLRLGPRAPWGLSARGRGPESKATGGSRLSDQTGQTETPATQARVLWF